VNRLHQIYFLRRRDGLIKIGTSSNFAARLAALTKSHGALEVVRVINGDAQRERMLHSEFKRHHEYGEWFRDADGELTAAIQSLPEGAAAEVAATKAAGDWIAGEAAFMEGVRAVVEATVATHRLRTGL
jgi:hypothetical protein